MGVVIVFVLLFAFGFWGIWIAIKDDPSKPKGDE